MSFLIIILLFLLSFLLSAVRRHQSSSIQYQSSLLLALKPRATWCEHSSLRYEELGAKFVTRLSGRSPKPYSPSRAGELCWGGTLLAGCCPAWDGHEGFSHRRIRPLALQPTQISRKLRTGKLPHPVLYHNLAKPLDCPLQFALKASTSFPGPLPWTHVDLSGYPPSLKDFQLIFDDGI